MPTMELCKTSSCWHLPRAGVGDCGFTDLVGVSAEYPHRYFSMVLFSLSISIVSSGARRGNHKIMRTGAFASLQNFFRIRGV